MQMRASALGVRFADLAKVCDHYFGEPRQRGTSHRSIACRGRAIPRVNIQDDHGMAKPYQVRQVLAAIDKLEGGNAMTKVNADHYTYRVRWSAEDHAFVGTVAELPSLSWIADVQREAFDGIRDLVASVLEDMEAAGESAPVPVADRAYSGKFMVRLTPGGAPSACARCRGAARVAEPPRGESPDRDLIRHRLHG